MLRVPVIPYDRRVKKTKKSAKVLRLRHLFLYICSLKKKQRTFSKNSQSYLLMYYRSCIQSFAAFFRLFFLPLFFY